MRPLLISAGPHSRLDGIRGSNAKSGQPCHPGGYQRTARSTFLVLRRDRIRADLRALFVYDSGAYPVALLRFRWADRQDTENL